jgi:phytoene dehydrogenase-like protein
VRRPQHVRTMARFGAVGALSAERLAAWQFAGDHARALVAGLAAHGGTELDTMLTGGLALTLGFSAHAVGWPLPAGGTGAITDALAAKARQYGGMIETSVHVSDLAQLPPSRVTLLDVTPRRFAEMAERWTDAESLRRYRRWRHGVGVCKVDYVLSAPVPWTAAEVARTGTVHLGGSFHEIAAAERTTVRGRVPERPYVLVAQPSVLDPSRAPDGRHVLWAYCHVPNGHPGDVSDRIDAQIERFAPGFADVVLHKQVTTAPELEAWNPNLVGGDVSGGVVDLRQLVARPRLANPYATPLDGVFLCSSSTPPGPAVHGMCGWHAAHAALATL